MTEAKAMLTCKEVTELVTDYLEGRMSFMRRVNFHLHIGMCDHCRAYLRQMRLTVKTLGRLPDESIPSGVRDELLVRFRNMRPSGSPAVAARRPGFIAVLDGWLGRSRGWAVVAVVLFATALIGVLVGGHPGPLLGTWERCLLLELGAALLPIMALGLVVVRSRQRISAGSFAALAAGGAFVGFLSLLLACPYSRVTLHVLVVHVAGVLFSALLGAAASRLPALR
ncbi:MAG: anti-sigma factor family protein [Acidobacteriota bacterium]